MENIVYTGRPSLWILAYDFISIIKTMLILLVVLYLLQYPFGHTPEPNYLDEFFLFLSKIKNLYSMPFSMNFESFLLKLFSIFIMLKLLFFVLFIVRILTTEIKLSNERLSFRNGIFNKHQKDVELYRIKDISLDEPFMFRLLGLQNINIVSSDKASTFPKILGISKKLNLFEILRENVEKSRTMKGVTEVDFSN